MITLAGISPVNVEPLRTWAIVAAACSLLLVLETGFLWWRSYHKWPRRLIRGCAVSAAILSAGSATLAIRSWNAYLYYLSHGAPGRSPTLTAVLLYERAIRQALALYQTAGWTITALTAALLLVGAVVISKAQKSANSIEEHSAKHAV
jgi:hypothetical protein